MALRNTLNEVVEMVRAEARLSTNTSRGIDDRDNIVQLIRRYYETLCEDYSWEHLRLTREADESRKALSAGQREYDFPTTVNKQKIERAWVKWDGFWYPLTYGIQFGTYNYDDPDADDRTDPIDRWQRSGQDQFEVHPIPATTGTTTTYCVAFEGMKVPEALTGNTSRLDLDGTLVALFVAAEILAGNEQDTLAEIKANAAAARLASLKRNTAGDSRIAIGRGQVVAGSATRIPSVIRVR